MSEIAWKVAIETTGSAEAEILRGLLEAQGIEVWLSQEGAGKSVYPVTTGVFGKVEILVPETQLAQAKSILAEVDSGFYENGFHDNQEPDPMGE